MKTLRWLSRDRLRYLQIASAGTLVAATAAMAALAAPAPSARFKAVAGAGEIIDTSFVPHSMGAESVTVVVRLGGKSAAEAQADALAGAGRKLTKAEKDQVKAQLKVTQDGLKGQIHSVGGKVLAQFQSALNGIKVKIAASKLDQLSDRSRV